MTGLFSEDDCRSSAQYKYMEYTIHDRRDFSHVPSQLDSYYSTCFISRPHNGPFVNQFWSNLQIWDRSKVKKIPQNSLPTQIVCNAIASQFVCDDIAPPWHPDSISGPNLTQIQDWENASKLSSNSDCLQCQCFEIPFSLIHGARREIIKMP